MMNKHKIRQPGNFINETSKRKIQEGSDQYPCTAKWIEKSKKDYVPALGDVSGFVDHYQKVMAKVHVGNKLPFEKEKGNYRLYLT